MITWSRMYCLRPQDIGNGKVMLKGNKMLEIGIVGCGLQAATIAGYLGIYGDTYEICAIMDINFDFAKERLNEKKVNLNSKCRLYDNIEEFISNEKTLNGIIIGTPCHFHTDIACKLESLGVPLYLEKPVAITLEQATQLYTTFVNSKTPVEVSLPMRLCPLTCEVKNIIDSGIIGQVAQIVGYEDTSGDIYFSTWFRDFDKTGGMFMQKAVHDIDYQLFLAGSHPREICAMRAQMVFGGNKPFDLSCDQCSEQNSCLESPYHYFHKRGIGNSLKEAEQYRYGRRMCRFSKDITIDDINSCIIELENGAQISHSENFLVKNDACRRGARIYGHKGTIEMDFNGHIKIMSHFRKKTDEINLSQTQLSHYGGDKELVFDFLKTMKTGERARTDLITGNGFYSTITCLYARESADARQFIEIGFKS